VGTGAGPLSSTGLKERFLSLLPADLSALDPPGLLGGDSQSHNDQYDLTIRNNTVRASIMNTLKKTDLFNGGSSLSEAQEEMHGVEFLLEGGDLPFNLDTTMTVLRSDTSPAGDILERPELLVHSPVPIDEGIVRDLESLGNVTGLVASNLQHHLFLTDYHKKYPEATVYIAPAALGERLEDKLTDVDPTKMKVLEDGIRIFPGVEQMLLRGAPLMHNEVVFHHKQSRSLIVSDAFYPPYTDEDTPNWAVRLWFKMTKGGFRTANLPIYRTSRVLTHGSVDDLRDSVDAMCDRWEFDQIVAAHGSVPYTSQPEASFRSAWYGVGAEEPVVLAA
jgi:hypothetical protein